MYHLSHTQIQIYFNINKVKKKKTLNISKLITILEAIKKSLNKIAISE